jgi:hypothetical protein
MGEVEMRIIVLDEDQVDIRPNQFSGTQDLIAK